MEAQREVRARLDARLSSGDGGGTYDDMRERVAKLEATTEHLARDASHTRSLLEQMIDRLARIESRIDDLPTKTALTWGAILFFVALVGAVAGIVALN